MKFLVPFIARFHILKVISTIYGQIEVLAARDVEDQRKRVLKSRQMII